MRRRTNKLVMQHTLLTDGAIFWKKKMVILEPADVTQTLQSVRSSANIFRVKWLAAASLR